MILALLSSERTQVFSRENMVKEMNIKVLGGRMDLDSNRGGYIDTRHHTNIILGAIS